jgi:hypothetical protein
MAPKLSAPISSLAQWEKLPWAPPPAASPCRCPTAAHLPPLSLFLPWPSSLFPCSMGACPSAPAGHLSQHTPSSPPIRSSARSNNSHGWRPEIFLAPPSSSSSQPASLPYCCSPLPPFPWCGNKEPLLGLQPRRPSPCAQPFDPKTAALRRAPLPRTAPLSPS